MIKQKRYIVIKDKNDFHVGKDENEHWKVFFHGFVLGWDDNTKEYTFTDSEGLALMFEHLHSAQLVADEVYEQTGFFPSIDYIEHWKA